MRILVIQPFDDDLETLFGAIGRGRDPITQIHNEAPILTRILFIGDFFCNPDQ
jgi:hypothetical protein